MAVITEQIPTFRQALQVAKQNDILRSQQLLGDVPADGLSVVADYRDTEVLVEAARKANEELRDAVGKALGGNSGEIAGETAMQAIAIQGDFLARQHRARTLRHASFVRRAVHCVNRRMAHGQPGGYFDRRVGTYVEDLLKSANQ